MLMSSQHSPQLDDVNDIFGESDKPEVDAFDSRWVVISLLMVFILYQSLRRD